MLAAEDDIAAVARDVVAPAASMFFVGRVAGYPVALEGAQKLKEVSYVHAEAYPAAELKHGPLALVGPDMPTVVVLPDDHLLDKNLSLGRGDPGPARSGHRGDRRRAPDAVPDDDRFAAVLRVPRAEPELAPVLLGIPLQLLAYHAAVALGPRRRPAPQPGQERDRGVAVVRAGQPVVSGDEADVRRGLVGRRPARTRPCAGPRPRGPPPAPRSAGGG